MADATSGRLGRLARLTALYASQGIPFGFATAYLPLLLTQRADFTYSKSTLLTLASFPWLLKILWAPLADSKFWPSIGRRRSWILPAQALLVLTAIGGAFVDFKGPVPVLFGLAVVFNLWASVQDTAVDGLAVDLLPPSERGLGNAVQVGGYKLGMLAGGGGLVLVAEHSSPRVAMFALAGFVALLMLVPLTMKEPPAAASDGLPSDSSSAIKEVLASFRAPGWIATLVFIGTVKVFETMVSTPLKQLLVKERDFTPGDAAIAVAVLAMLFSLGGSLIGGWAAGKYQRRTCLAVFGVLQALGLVALAWAFRPDVDDLTLVVTICVEHLFAGMLTPALFAYMMDVSDPRIGASHYGTLAVVEVATKGATGAAAGKFVDVFGASPVIAACAGLGLVPLLLIPLIRKPHVPVEA